LINEADGVNGTDNGTGGIMGGERASSRDSHDELIDGSRRR